MNLSFESLNKYRLEKLPNEVFYIPNYIIEREEEEFLNRIYSVSDAKWTYLSKRRLQNWGGIPHEKGMVQEILPHWLSKYSVVLKSLFNDITPNHMLVNEYKPGQGIMPHQDGPLYYPTVAIISLQDNCLMNFYKPLNKEARVCECDGVMDEGSIKKGDHSISGLNGTLDNDTHFKSDKVETKSLDERLVGSLYLERRSLLVFRGEAYDTYLHGISGCKADVMNEKVVVREERAGDVIERKNTRVSVTIRVVPKTIKASKIFGKLNI